jgi:hypothetical protein
MRRPHVRNQTLNGRTTEAGHSKTRHVGSTMTLYDEYNHNIDSDQPGPTQHTRYIEQNEGNAEEW